MEPPVLFEKKDNIAVITLNRPEKRNAISQDLLIHFYNHLETIIHDPKIRAGIITGADPSFCAGLDLSRIATDNLMNPREDGVDLLDLIAMCEKPIIGAINGPAITGGFELALNCDFLIASENACFRDTHALLGIHPGWGMSQLLQRAVGIRMARQLSYSGQDITVDQALNLGLVNEVVAPERLMPRVMEIAEDICKTRVEFLPLYKKLIDQGHSMAKDSAMGLEKKGFLNFLKQSGMLK